MIALVQKENNLIHVLTLFLEKVYHAPDVQNILHKPVVWGHHFIIEEGFLFLQWGYSLTPALAADLHLSRTAVLWDQQIRYLPGYSVEILRFWPVAPVAFGLDPAYTRTNLHWHILPLSGEALQTPPLWRTLFSNKDFPVRPYRLPQSLLGLQLSNVLWNSEQQNILCNSRAAACSTLSGNDKRYDSMSLYTEILDLTTAISPITKYNLQLVMTKLTRVSVICMSGHFR